MYVSCRIHSRVVGNFMATFMPISFYFDFVGRERERSDCSFLLQFLHEVPLNHYMRLSNGRFTPWTMESDHGRWPFPMVWLSRSYFYYYLLLFFKQCTKSLGPPLGVNRMWIKRNDHAQKLNVLIFVLYAQKGRFWKKNKIEFDHSLCLVLSSSSLPQKKFIKNWVKHLPEDVFGLSHHNTSWTMSVDNVRHKIWLLGTLNSMVTLIFFSFMYTEVVTGWVQQPIIDFTRPSDDFMVHGVNNP